MTLGDAENKSDATLDYHFSKRGPGVPEAAQLYGFTSPSSAQDLFVTFEKLGFSL